MTGMPVLLKKLVQQQKYLNMENTVTLISASDSKPEFVNVSKLSKLGGKLMGQCGLSYYPMRQTELSP